MFPGGAYLLAFLGALVTTLAALPLWRAWCVRANLVDDPGHRKIHDEPIPLACGLAVFTGLAAPLAAGALAVKFYLLGVDADTLLEHGFERRALQLGAIFFGALGMLVLGYFDDKHELRAASKFIGQLAIAALVAAAGVRITLFVPSVVFSYGVTILWILTVTNAMNFLDNMNGLCAGLGGIAALSFGGIAALHGQYLVASLALLAAGALAGFLPYNYPKASAFLGDSGSHLTGFLLAVLAILPHFYTAQNPRPLAVLAPLLVLAVPLGDMGCVMWIRWRAGAPVWEGDTNHFSHRLVRRGLGKPQAVAVIWSLHAAACAAAVWLGS
ncbi:MAG: undecaprenyl/decaprenyl-phosphate alpha-N-acetylglucosaminyl 1-phosphate transferase [Verrucomicrobia bacterium]|nr:undecaprenyl/decaprenyl-phosphate alpha-N-acetylglucosaminyl 1-phosphate transferase [Verrucomicrobiota bacterium]